MYIRITYTDLDSEQLRPQVERIFQETPGLYTTFADEVLDFGKDVTDDLITGPPGEAMTTRSATPRSTVHDPRRVFVVHGRDSNARDAMFAFLRSIDLYPLEWAEAVTETGKASPYVGDVLDEAFSIAQAVVVLMTPDDVACLQEPFRKPGDPPHETELTPQARPNVIFEAGMAMGRSPDRTVLVELGELRPFSDVGGRHVIRLDNTTQRRQELAQRLETAGCPVSMTGTDWHRAGDFMVAIDRT
jgi:predicted nucleotide-binding protein